MFLTMVIAALLLSAATLGVAYHDHDQAFAYVGLFVTSLVAGTLLPFLPASSELAMAGLLATGSGIAFLLIATATLGTIFGATANYYVGRNMVRFSNRSWFPISESKLHRTSEWFQRYGIWLILLCWLPTAGDAITVVAGLLRADLRVFLLFTALGKGFGHVTVAGGVGLVS